MTNTDEKSEQVTSANDSDVIEKDYLIRVRCSTYHDGHKSCRITDIGVDHPDKDPPTPTTAEPNIEAPPKVTAPATTLTTDQSTFVDAAHAAENPKETGKDCEICDIVEDLVREKAQADAAAKAAAAAPRRFSSMGRRFAPRINDGQAPT